MDSRELVTNGREFYDKGMSKALAYLQSEGYTALFIPQLADIRIESNIDSKIWQNEYASTSLVVTGRYKDDGKATSPVETLFVHVPHFLSNSKNLIRAIRDRKARTEDMWPKHRGAVKVPQEEYDRLRGMVNDENIFVVNHRTLVENNYDSLHIDDALEHPQTIPFLGGEERAIKYLKKYSNLSDRITIMYGEDLPEEPMGRFLFLGSNNKVASLSAINCFYNPGRFIGV
ncbi:hypothetical protein CL617_05820 [archaeon]|nr:hypothetical protein [archaeon]|tara:strand:+ start:12164 stop:12853 length:690 start_codon:yes stop_codon:yes gene_type:complete